MAPKDTSKPAYTAGELFGMMNDAGADAFYCETPSMLIAQISPGSSYFRSKVEGGIGLEILTLDWVSYARFSGPLSDTSTAGESARKAVVEKLGTSWGSTGLPDTVTLEELPAQPSKCLEWISITSEDLTDITSRTDGSVAFSVGAGGSDAPAGTGQLTFTASGKPVGVSFLTESGELGMFISLGNVPSDVLPEYGKDIDGKLVPGVVTNISPDEYEALVSGAG